MNRGNGLNKRHPEKDNREAIEICKTFGCGRKLKPTELLYGNYCFNCAAKRNQKERERLKYTNSHTNYFIQVYRWSALNNSWIKHFHKEISTDQFIKYIDSEDYKPDESKLFYRYDIYVNTIVVDTIYAFNPNLYE